MSEEEEEQCPFDILPSELVYQIFHYLPSITILRNIRCLSKRFYKLVNSYNEHRLNCRSISQSNFVFLLNYLKHENIRSLTLSDNDETPGQIQLFLSICRLHQFSQLHSLILEDIDQCHLNCFLEDILKLKLNSLKISSKRDYSSNEIDLNSLSSVMSLSRLSHFSLNIATFQLTFFQYPFESHIKSLEMNCSRLNQYFDLVRYFPNIEKLVLFGLKEIESEQTYEIGDQLDGFNQLKYLIIKDGSIDLFILEKILLFAPTLIDLQLFKSIDLILFVSQLNHLEIFVQLNVPFLKRFLFYFIGKSSDLSNLSIGIESLIDLFKRSYWIDIVKCCVQCIYMKSDGTVILHTPPLIDEEYSYRYQFKDLISFQSNPTEMNNYSITNQMKCLHVDLSGVMNVVTSNKGGLPGKIIYPSIEELHLSIGNEWPLSSLRFLTNLICLSNVQMLSLSSYSFGNLSNAFYEQLNCILKQLIQLSPKLHSLRLFTGSNYLDNICEKRIDLSKIIPSNIKHLKIFISNIDHMNFIIQQLKHLSSIHFHHYPYFRNNSSHLFVQWLQQYTIHHPYSTHRIDQSSLFLWINDHH